MAQQVVISYVNSSFLDRPSLEDVTQYSAAADLWKAVAPCLPAWLTKEHVCAEADLKQQWKESPGHILQLTFCL